MRAAVAMALVGVLALVGGIWWFESPPDLKIVPETLSTSETTNCAVTTDGEAACWGYVFPHGSAAHVVGTGGIDDAVGVAPWGSFSACALHADAQLSCWGLRDVDTTVQNANAWEFAPPRRVEGLTNVISLDSHLHVCALRRQGTVHCLFYAYGAHGSFDQVAMIEDAVDLIVGEYLLCVLTTGGEMQCAGWDRPADVEPLRSIATGANGLFKVPRSNISEELACATFANSPPKCWGADFALRETLTNLDGASTIFAVQPGTVCSDVASIQCQSITTEVDGGSFEYSGPSDAELITQGRLHNCASRPDGTVQCWGIAFGGMGTLGDADNTYSTWDTGGSVTVAKRSVSDTTQWRWKIGSMGLIAIGVLNAARHARRRSMHSALGA